MYDELVLLELKEFGGRTLVSIENDMKTDSADKTDTVVGKCVENVYLELSTSFDRKCNTSLSVFFYTLFTYFL